ncbi:helix-turn-helix domain-containing protein, partial [Xylella fastidiosa]
YTSQEVSVKDICTRYNITRSTFYRVVLERDYTTREKA